MMPAPDIAAWALTIAVAVGSVVALVKDRRDIALGILAAAGSFSLITAPIEDVDIRLEQPAVVALAVILLARERNTIVKVARAGKWPIGLLSVYLAANAVSAMFVAPNPVPSLRLVAWMGISLVAFGIAAVLVAGGLGRASDRGFSVWLVASACLHSVVSILQVVAEVLVESDWGVLRSDVPIGKAFGLAWEPNLLAITLAVAAIFLIEPSSARRFKPPILRATRILIAVGIALAISRGGIVALCVGVGVVAVGMARGAPVRWDRGDGWAFLRSSSLIVLISVAGYAALGSLGSMGVGQRPGDTPPTPEVAQGTLIPAEPTPTGAGTSPSSAPTTASPTPSGAGATPAPPTATDHPVAPPVFVGAGETIALRLRNLEVAIENAWSSPLVGLGPGAFGQRYTEPTCACPAHIPNQVAATFFESGLMGLVGLVGALFWIARGAWRVGAVAHVAALVTLLVGYQFTDALRFGSSWLLVGVLLGLAVARSGPENPASAQPPSATR